MSDFTAETWVLLGMVAAVGAIGILYTLAQTFAHERRVHELKIRVVELRRSYSKRLAEMGRPHGDTGEVIDAIPVDQQP